MNRKRKKRIEELIGQISDLQNEVKQLLEEEQEAYNNLPENLQESECGERMERAVEQLDCADSSLEETIDYLSDIE